MKKTIGIDNNQASIEMLKNRFLINQNFLGAYNVNDFNIE